MTASMTGNVVIPPAPATMQQPRRGKQLPLRISSLLLCLAVCIVVLQIRVFFHATYVHNHADADADVNNAYGDASHRHRRDGTISSPKSTLEERPPSSMFASSKSSAATDASTPRSRPQASSKTSSSSSPIFSSPKLLIGIISGNQNFLTRRYRTRHQQLFELWNDPRLCAFGDFVDRQQKSDDARTDQCQVLYTFVLGAHNETSNMPTILVNNKSDDHDDHDKGCDSSERWPLTIPEMPIWQSHYGDAYERPNDFTILNIKDNMNEGKTPTFLHWAHQMATRYNIPYIAKCDSDSVLRWPSLLNFIDQQLPMPTKTTPMTELPPVVLGAIRSKATWDDDAADETFWQQEFQTGLHLYLTGSFFLMSSSLAGAAVEEVKRQLQRRLPGRYHHDSLGCPYQHDQQQRPISFKKVSFFEGHEDHDALSAAQVAVNHQRAIRWILPLKAQQFWEHPVKGKYRWERIWDREQRRKRTTTATQSNFHWSEDISIATTATPSLSTSSLLIILGAVSIEERQRYREELKQNAVDGVRICAFHATRQPDTSAPPCNLYFLFVIGTTDATTAVDSSSTVSFVDIDRLVARDAVGTDTSNADVVVLNVVENVHNGMGATVLYWIQETLLLSSQDPTFFDMILFCQAAVRFDVSKWRDMKLDHQDFLSPTTRSTSTRVNRPYFLVGDVRDRRQRPIEFTRIQFLNRTSSHFELFGKNYESIHLYLGSECLGISSNLVNYIVEQARQNPDLNDNGEFFVGDLGHDLASMVHLATQQHNKTIVLQWVPVPKSLQFWESSEESTSSITFPKKVAAPGFKTDVEKIFSCSYGKGVNATVVTLPQQGRPPSFIMIGVQKSGTTALLSYLRDYHANVLQTRKALRREAHFFDTAWVGILKQATSMGLVQANEKHCLALAEYMKLFYVNEISHSAEEGNATQQLYTFEKTPSYFCNPKIPQRIRQVVPWSKAIVILRDPVDRLYSHYKMTVKDVFTLRSKTLEEFLHHEVQAMLDFQMTTAPLPPLLNGTTPTNTLYQPDVPFDHPLPESSWKPKMAINAYTKHPDFGHQILLRRGLYAVQLRWWLKHFTLNKNLLVINYNDLLEDSRAVLYRILDFAGIPIVTVGNNSTNNTTAYGKVRADKRKGDRPMSDATRRYLRQFYAPYNAELEELLGPDWSENRLGW